jgi:hypothetical protein
MVQLKKSLRKKLNEFYDRHCNRSVKLKAGVLYLQNY